MGDILLHYKTGRVKGKLWDQNIGVWLCVHPNDYSTLDELADEVLSCADAVVWYCANEVRSQEESQKLLEKIDEMKLMVVLVTESFLCLESRARDLELRYAREHHMLILPLFGKDLSRCRNGNMDFAQQ